MHGKLLCSFRLRQHSHLWHHNLIQGIKIKITCTGHQCAEIMFKYALLWLFISFYLKMLFLFSIFYLPFSAITNETDYEEVRMPTGTWSGFGFSKSMPESTLKDLVSDWA